MSIAAEKSKAPLEAAEVLAALDGFWADPQPGFRGSVPQRKIAGSEWDQAVPEGTQNPYWEIIRQFPLDELGSAFSPGRPEPAMYAAKRGGPSGLGEIVVTRDGLCMTFAWSIPSPGDMAWMREVLGGRGVVEAGAGGGYWAWQMRQAGIDVAAYEPLEVPGNKYARREWTALLCDGHDAPRHHPDRALFLCWPSYGDPWAARALSCYRGDMLVYCGEGEGGCCADDEFFRLLGAEWEEAGTSPAHVSFWGIHCYLTAYRRKT